MACGLDKYSAKACRQKIRGKGKKREIWKVISNV
tara:strand:- start:212 stop:313 length:102 start_codon:yes stop_codon:yes gene_type:complete